MFTARDNFDFRNYETYENFLGEIDVEPNAAKIFDNKQGAIVETKAPEAKEQTSENNLGGLSRHEQAARQAAVAEAKVRAAEDAIREKEEAEKRALEEARRIKEDAKRKLDTPDITDIPLTPVETTEAPATPRRKEPARTSEDTPARRKEKTEEPRRPAVAKRGEQQRRRTGKLTINDALNDEE